MSADPRAASGVAPSVTGNPTPPRDVALDALRGIAILGMVLSGSVAFGSSLPGWMFHAQVPPPLHRFVPTLPGITWVDLVFPFFLFAMGAAIPIALRGATPQRMLWTALRRFALLLWLALFSQHMKAASLSAAPDAATQGLVLAGFVLLGLQFGGGPRGLRLAAWAVALALMALLPFRDGLGFKPTRQDIILVVLANMALVATPLWWFTRRLPGGGLARLAVLPLVAAVLLGGSVVGSWNQGLFKATPAAWAYQFLFLKYLFIVVPGTFVGEWLLRERSAAWPVRPVPAGLAWLALLLLLVNTTLLYTRDLRLNLAFTLLALAWMLRSAMRAGELDRRLSMLGGWLLVAGLAFEALEGGIRKDSSTFSYYFVTSGLACFALIGLRGLATSRVAAGWGARVVAPFAEQGRNPLLAYVAGALLVLPLLHLGGVHAFWAALQGGFWLGLAKGLVFTGAVAAVTALATRRGWVWKA